MDGKARFRSGHDHALLRSGDRVPQRNTAFLGGACPRHVFANGILIEELETRVSTFTVSSSPSAFFSLLACLFVVIRESDAARGFTCRAANAHVARGVAANARGIAVALIPTHRTAGVSRISTHVWAQFNRCWLFLYHFYRTPIYIGTDVNLTLSMFNVEYTCHDKMAFLFDNEYSSCSTKICSTHHAEYSSCSTKQYHSRL